MYWNLAALKFGSIFGFCTLWRARSAAGEGPQSAVLERKVFTWLWRVAECSIENVVDGGSDMEEKSSEGVVVDTTANFGRQKEQQRVCGVCCSTVVFH
jgi:hypothetical protein